MSSTILVKNNTSKTKFSYLIQAVGVLLLFVYILAGIVTHTGLLATWSTDGSMIVMSDFNHYDRAARETALGGDPYRERGIGFAFVYPPPALLVINIFRLVPDAARPVVFWVVNALLMIAITASLAKHYKADRMKMLAWLVLALFFAPFLELETIGQINVITLAGIALMFLFEDRNPWVAGFGLSLAIVTKLSPLILLGYLFASRQYRVILTSLVCTVLFCIAAGFAYSFQHYATYVDVLTGMFGFFAEDKNIQGLASKLVALGLMGIETAPQFQRLLTIYFAAVLLLSGVLTLITRQKEPLLIVTLFSMVLYPSIVWYHHYVFLLFPLLILMTWSRFRLEVVAWCMILLIIIQVDRFRLTTGLVIHLLAHATLWGLIIAQWREAAKLLPAKGQTVNLE